MKDLINLYSDGGSRGNPGPAAAAYLLYDREGNLLEREGVFLRITTNNVAEYQALKLGLTAAGRHLPQKIICHLDSELVVRQLNGIYRIKESSLRALAVSVHALAGKIDSVEYRYVPREQNRDADRLVNDVLDRYIR